MQQLALSCLAILSSCTCRPAVAVVLAQVSVTATATGATAHGLPAAARSAAHQRVAQCPGHVYRNVVLGIGMDLPHTTFVNGTAACCWANQNLGAENGF